MTTFHTHHIEGKLGTTYTIKPQNPYFSKSCIS